MSSLHTEYIGVLGRPHGIDGGCILSDVVTLAKPIAPGTTVHVGYSRDFAKAYTVLDFKQNENRSVIKLAGVDSAEAVAMLADNAVYAMPEDIGITSTDRYRIGDIEGASVVDVAGNHIGTITDVWLLPANDVWVVTTDALSTLPLPVIDEVIKAVDIEKRVVTVRLLDGLDRVDNNEDLEPDA